MYVITGATGNIGKLIAEALLDAGKPVRVIGRSAEKLAALTSRGAEAAVGSLDDVDFLTQAFEGATALYALIPPQYAAEDFRAYQNQVGEAIAKAIRAARVPYVVNLSSQGAERPDKNGPVGGLYDQEQRLNALSDVNIVHLRPTYFLENFLSNIGIIKGMGIHGAPLGPDVPFSAIATPDIAKVATEYLLNLDWSGHSVRDLLGPRDITMGEATRVLGQAIGREDLPYVQFSYEDAKQGMVGAGLSPDVARLMVEMNQAMNEEGLAPTPRTPDNTTPTTLEEFAPTFAAVYHAS